MIGGSFLDAESEKKYYKSHKRAKACIVSFPKSGRTWLRVLLGKVLCEKFSLPEQLILKTYKLSKAAKILPTIFTHDGSDTKLSCPYNRLEIDKARYRGKKVIFLIRDPRDLVVSCYFQAIKRVKNYQGAISSFIRSDNYGVKKSVQFYNIWYENQKVGEDFLLIRYEEMQADPFGILRSVLEFLDVKGVEKEIIEGAVSFASFDNMKSMEKSGYFPQNTMRPRSLEDEDSYKVRKGKVGGYTDYLSIEDIQYIDKVVAKMKWPFYKSN